MDANLESFGEILVSDARDDAVRLVDAFVRGGNTAQDAAWGEIFRTKSSHEAVAKLAPDIVDIAIACVLRAIDRGRLRLSYHIGETAVDLTSVGDGELEGAYGGDWRFRHSTERANDYLADLTLDDLDDLLGNGAD